MKSGACRLECTSSCTYQSWVQRYGGAVRKLSKAYVPLAGAFAVAVPRIPFLSLSPSVIMKAGSPGFAHLVRQSEYLDSLLQSL